MMINKRLIAMIPEAKRYIMLKTLVNWVSLLAGICLWFSVAGLLESALPGRSKAGIGMVLLLAVVCIVIRFVMAHLSAYMTHKAVSCVKLRLRTVIYDKLRRLGAEYSDHCPTAEVVQLAGEGIEQLESYFGNYLPQLMYALLAPLTLFAVFFPLSRLTAIVLFICVPLIPAAIVSVQTVAKRLLGSYWDAYANLGDTFLENLQGLTTLKVYNADAERHKAMNEEAERFRKITMKVLTMQLNSVTVMDMVAYGGTALGSILSASAFAHGGVSLGNTIAMILLASEFFLAMRALGSYFHVAMNGMAASDRMFRLLDSPEPQNGTENVSAGSFCARELSFAYQPEKLVLANLMFQIPQGSITAVVGESGCGKSTLASILCGARNEYMGSLTVNGIEMKDIRREELHKLVTAVSSTSYLFAGTVRESLRMGKTDATDAEMWRVLMQVNLLPFVQARGGLDMQVTERGSNLSGGQRQRLALARALLKNSKVYIFDEATSNIDAESEADIMRVIYGLKGSHTVIVISHRLANVVNADEIVFLHHGMIAEQGNHAVLMARNGEYASLFRHQQELENIRKENRPQ